MRTATRPDSSGRPAAGFTILETVIALFIAMVIGFGAISLFLFATSYNAGASDRARALALAQQRMEALRGASYDELATTDSTEQVPVGDAAQADLKTFTVNTRIEYDAAVPLNRQRRITITVTPPANGRWTSGSVSLVMLRASDEVGDN